MSGSGPIAGVSRFVKREWYTLAIVGMVVLASFLPIGGRPAVVFDHATTLAIALLFFLHGARLSRDVVIAGVTHWRLHLVILATTFVLFPVLGLIIWAIPGVLPEALKTGIMFLAVLPSTVQSSIAFVSIARGNVPAAVCAASASNIFGMFITPLLVGLIFHNIGSGPGFSLDALEAIVLQLLLPFVAGQLVQPWLGPVLRRHKLLTQTVDRGSILMVVYAAFSEAVIGGLWHKVSVDALAIVVAIDIVLLAVVLVITWFGSAAIGFNREDRITIMFCGSKKSLASGAPMANVLFAGQDVGAIVLPLMFFHQIQLMVCAVLARRFAASAPPEEDLHGHA
ncbi:bile acid:sodium symporter family protein [Pseudoxanthobacter sp.]|uniref:bile acid:sodium symporter family protein n=1 Tax=Pseudoxanthobacter sp. TaxID=1925742 RepID=UPI002FE00CAC